MFLGYKIDTKGLQDPRCHEQWGLRASKLVKIPLKRADILFLGYLNEREYTKYGTFKNFKRWGYIGLMNGEYYLLHKFSLRTLQHLFKSRCHLKSKVRIKDIRCGNEIQAIDWHFVIYKRWKKLGIGLDYPV